MSTIKWHGNPETATTKERPSHIIAVVRVGFDYCFFIDKDKKTVEKEIAALMAIFSEEKKSAIKEITGEMFRVYDSAFVVRMNPLDLFSALITEIGTNTETQH